MLNELDRFRRDAWMRKLANSRSGESILVGDNNVTLAEVHRWLVSAVKNERTANQGHKQELQDSGSWGIQL